MIDELELGWRLHPAPMLAVTGTNGKTTVSSLATAVLAGNERRVSLAGNAEQGAPLSAVDPSADWIVCEVSSFQLEGCTALRPEVAVFTNLTHDHLARHGSMARYGRLKRRLLVRGDDVVPLAVIDVAGEFGRRLADEVEALGGRVVRIGFDQLADYEIRTARWDLHGAAFGLRTPTGDLTLETRLPGVHNARNVAAAVAIAIGRRRPRGPGRDARDNSGGRLGADQPRRPDPGPHRLPVTQQWLRTLHADQPRRAAVGGARGSWLA